MSQKTQIEIEKTDGAIFFTKEGVELMIPDFEDDDILPEHLYPLFAIAGKIHDKEFLQAAWEDFNKKVEESKSD